MWVLLGAPSRRTRGWASTHRVGGHLCPALKGWGLWREGTESTLGHASLSPGIHKAHVALGDPGGCMLEHITSKEWGHVAPPAVHLLSSSPIFPRVTKKGSLGICLSPAPAAWEAVPASLGQAVSLLPGARAHTYLSFASHAPALRFCCSFSFFPAAAQSLPFFSGFLGAPVLALSLPPALSPATATFSLVSASWNK